jgi:hypothetical protein
MSPEQKQLKQKYASLDARMVELFFRLDPMGIAFDGEDSAFGPNYDEYSPEVGTILPRLKETQSEADVFSVIREEFSKWFGPLSISEFDRPVYVELSRETWKLWNESEKVG